MSKTPVKLEPTVQFLIEQINILDRFSGNIPFLMLKPTPEGKIVVHAQDPGGFVVINATSLEPLGIPHPARLDNLSYLRSILDLIQKTTARGTSTPLEFETKVAVDGKTTVIKQIRFRTSTTTFAFQASDPFLHKTTVRTTKIENWPLEFHLGPAKIESFEDAARIHLAGTLKAEDQDFFRLSIEKTGEIIARFKSRSGEIVYNLHQVPNPNEFVLDETYSISTFRSVLSALGPDGGIFRVSPLAISVQTETHAGLYTFVMTRKIPT